ncbi:MAG: DUF448 domain-containing protein [Zetaproteobacteria bacterium]|nr:MAG: DUF448 domain-containing protein [Zetaproteobacteria bacterium]
MRLVVDQDGLIWPDLLQQAPGRGFYLCMGKDCLRRMHNGTFHRLKGKFPKLRGDWKALRLRMLKALDLRIVMLLRSMRTGASLGRDAVLQRMWNNAPLVVVLARDAGEALVRQIAMAVEKRRAAGARTVVVHALDTRRLGEPFARERLAVVGFDEGRLTTELVKNCAWLERLEGIEV